MLLVAELTAFVLGFGGLFHLRHCHGSLGAHSGSPCGCGRRPVSVAFTDMAGSSCQFPRTPFTEGTEPSAPFLRGVVRVGPYVIMVETWCCYKTTQRNAASGDFQMIFVSAKFPWLFSTLTWVPALCVRLGPWF